MADVDAGGGVVVRTDRRKARYLVVHRPRYDDWSLPKGKLDGGEAFQDGAHREVEEETGLRVRLVRELSAVRYRDNKGRAKLVRYWLMAPTSDPDAPGEHDDEVDDLRWVRRREARELLTYAHDVELVDEAHELRRHFDLAVPPVFVTRHAHAGDRATWVGDQDRRPLSDRGRLEADGLVPQLATSGIERIISSPLLRCRQTVKPLAKRLGLSIERDERLAEGARDAEVRDLVEEVVGTGTVLCSHGDVIGSYLGGVRTRGVELDDDLSWPKGSTWVMRTRDGAVVGGHRLPVPGASHVGR